MHTFGSSNGGNFAFPSNMTLASIGTCWNGLACQPTWGNRTVADMSLAIKAVYSNDNYLACIYNTTNTLDRSESTQYIAQYGKDGRLTGSRVETISPRGNITVSGTPWPDAQCCGNVCESSTDPGFGAVKTNRTNSTAPSSARAQASETDSGPSHLNFGQVVLQGLLGVPAPSTPSPSAKPGSRTAKATISASYAATAACKVKAPRITAMPTATVTVTVTATVATTTTIAQKAQIDAAIAAGVSKAMAEWQAQQISQSKEVVGRSSSPLKAVKTKKKANKAETVSDNMRTVLPTPIAPSKQNKQDQKAIKGKNGPKAQADKQAGLPPYLDPFRSKMTKRRR
ncbi:hypothetical protein FRB96_008033 [Tulasnella sp. 330]|nr:hypothetical protein FRB96_008033 [Tulasnella sp. 330]KAG8878543.1 hypothetical protein FRB97_002412 [Tulasnella sp. 331]KAG8885475.1 hypothetical protein FRB98_001788 [Tulasnella sp. 332]